MHRTPLNIATHGIRILRNGSEVFPRMLDALDTAKHTVRIEMYWWDSDALGRTFLEHAIAAAKRGVDVAVLVDGFGSLALPRHFWDPLLAAGGRVAVFHPLVPTFTRAGFRVLLARDHRKVVVADGRSFIGGLNFARVWLPRSEGGDNWRDTAVEIEGAAAARHLTEVFEASWGELHGKAFTTPRAVPMWQDGGELAIVSNLPRQRRGRRIRKLYHWALRRARHSIDITCSYFSPRPIFLHALTSAVKRGVRVRLLVPLHSDIELARQVSLPLLRYLDGRGVQVFAYEPSILHAKTAVVDDDWCTVGSHNLDGLSWAWNLECNVVMRNRSAAAQLTGLFEEDLARAVRWPPPGRPSFLERVLPSAFSRWLSG